MCMDSPQCSLLGISYSLIVYLYMFHSNTEFVIISSHNGTWVNSLTQRPMETLFWSLCKYPQSVCEDALRIQYFDLTQRQKTPQNISNFPIIFSSALFQCVNIDENEIKD